MLERFGPLRLDDIKLEQLALFLSPAAFARWPTNEGLMAEGGTSGSSSTRIGRLLDGLERCPLFRVIDGVVYSTQAVSSIIISKSDKLSVHFLALRNPFAQSDYGSHDG